MAALNLKVGQTIQSQDGREGVIRYIGTLHIAAGEWLGLELPDSSGKNDGSVKGERYFQCSPGNGIFVRKESAVRIVQQPAPVSRANGSTTSANGITPKARPSVGVSADVARKRQSLMSGGSNSAPGSRLSMRSPTKSPTKPTRSSASSATSTPRTGTPATTGRTSDSSTKSRPSIAGRTSMGPPSTTSKTAPYGSRPSISGTTPRTTSSRPSVTGSRQSLGVSKLSVQPKTTPKVNPRLPRTSEPKPVEEEEPIISPTIPEEEEDHESDGMGVQGPELKEELGQDTSHRAKPSPEPSNTSRARPATVARDSNTSVELRTAAKKEVEQLKATVRTLERKALENRDRLKSIDALQDERDRFEGIIQALQKKLKTNQQEMLKLKSKYNDLKTHPDQAPDRTAEHESEMELATLDKEMAEERAEMFHAELEALKMKHEELALEAEILREENRELGSVMSPEEKAGAGWLQMEREQERLRQALILLRDVSQQNEGDLKHQVKELQETLDDAEKMASMYDDVADRLKRSDETNKHLREQLEAAETNDEVMEAMEAQREQSMSVIEHLKKQVQDLEEHIQVTDELESFHVEEEKRLHYQLDESEAILNDKLRGAAEQQKVIEDLEYTLTKFRDVVRGLQSDIDELRRSRDISEVEAHEMSSKSRAMMDLNLQLQNTATKTQLKAIDLETGRMRAEQASLHLEIVQLFVPDSFDTERLPVLALLCFKRIMSMAALIKNILGERMRDRPHLVQDDPFTVFEVMEKMSRIASFCDRFVRFLASCSTESFARFRGSPFELEPVERSMTGWIEALRRDELASDGPEHLQRMIGILQDMAEKLIPESDQSKATELVTQASMVENYADSIAQQLGIIVKAVQSRLGPPGDDDEESLTFDKNMDHFGTKARTAKYLCSKGVQQLGDLQSGSMCLGETSWDFFEDADEFAGQLAHLVRVTGKAVLEHLGQLDQEASLSYSSIAATMSTAVHSAHLLSEARPSADDALDYLATQLQLLQGRVDELNIKASDISSSTEFEPLPAPWTIRAKEIKAQKIVSQDVQEELTRLKSKVQEQVTRLGEKDKVIEEQQIRVHLLESRSKESKIRDESVKAMKEEIERLGVEKMDAIANLGKLETEHNSLLQARETDRKELEVFKAAALVESGAPLPGLVDEFATQHLKAEVDLLNHEITSLQSAVRFLKQENHGLRIPVGDVAIAASKNTWLHPAHLVRPKSNVRAERLRREGQDLFAGLMDLAMTAKPVVLRVKNGQPSSIEASTGGKPTWKARQYDYATRYQMAKQREDLEKWIEWKTDMIRQARLENPGARRLRNTATTAEAASAATGNGWKGQSKKLGLETSGQRLQIVENSP